MAEVFIGSTVGAEGFSRRVAIKRVLPGYSDNEAFARMFVEEARITSQLVHPNIVSVVDFDRDRENRLFLVMELVEGKDLDALAGTGAMPVPVLIFIISEVLRGLGYAHDLPVGNQSRGVVHRDISPHNVLLSWTGMVKVSDFGIAKARAASEATASEFIKGKPAYMSPEQANGQRLDGRSDLFAVGVMLWEMLVGRRLFVAEDTRATLAAVLFGQIPRPRTLRGDIPKDLERVCMKLLEREPANRYATAEEAVHDLLECTDAPKAGRELLVKTLAERFVGQAPVRQSLIRHGQPAQYNPALLGFDATAAGPQTPSPMQHAQTAPAAAVSMGAIMNAPTGTMQPLPKRKGTTLILIIVAIAIASGAIALGITVALKGGKEPQVATTDPPKPDAPPVPPPDAATPDAAAVVVTQPADAAPPDAPPPDAGNPGRNGAQQPPPREKKMGTLLVTSFPITRVSIDGVVYKDSPVSTSIAEGTHTITIVNSDTEPPINARLTVKVTAGKQTKAHFPSSELPWIKK